MGRRRTPTALRVLNGNPSHAAINHFEPMPEPLDAAMPAELTAADARAEWKRSIVPAITIGQITIADRALAIAHCELFSTWRSQVALAATQPHVIKAGKHGYPMPNPARNMANRTLQIMASVDDKLGFSPTSRSKVQAAGPGSVRANVDTRRASFLKATDQRG